MSKKVFINAGHGGKDSGAVSDGFIEKDMNLKVAKSVNAFLKAAGVDTYMMREGDETYRQKDVYTACNNYKPDVAVDIHFNAGGGDGFEALVGLGTDFGKTIEKQVKAWGQNSRGIKVNKKMYFINSISATSIILEGAFIDNKADRQCVDSDEKLESLGIAYAKGICDYLGVSYSDKSTPTSTPTPTPGKEAYLVKITADCLNVRAGAGTDYPVTCQIKDHGVYTIVEEATGKNGTGSSNFGKLKSGAGWICLDYAKKYK